MKPTLKHTPDSYSYRDMLVKFAGGIPLSCDQLNFLAWHQHTLSNQAIDPLIKYYLKHLHGYYGNTHSFLLPGEALNKVSIEQMKKRLKILLQSKSSRVELRLTPKEFTEFEGLTFKELILYHGNQFLTGAPFYYGGLPHITYFQWGNFFGVTKYVILPGEKALKSNVLIYFEDMAERDLDQCVQDYKLKLHDELKNQEDLTPAPRLHEEPKYQSIFSIPTLTHGVNNHAKETESK